MNSIIVGTLDGFGANVSRYHQLWETYQRAGAKTAQGEVPKIGLVSHLVLADTDEEAAQAAQPAWDQYLWNLFTPRRLEAESRGLGELFSGGEERPSGLPDREAGPAYQAPASPNRRRGSEPGQVVEHGGSASFRVIAGSPSTIKAYLRSGSGNLNRGISGIAA